MDGCAAKCNRFLPERMEIKNKEHHICDRCPTPVQQVPDNLPPDLFPRQNQTFWMSLADAGNLFRYGCTEICLFVTARRDTVLHIDIVTDNRLQMMFK